MKTLAASAEGKKALSGTRQGIVGGGLLILALVLWGARDFIPALATTRVVATAVVSTSHDGSEAQLQRAFAAAKMSCPAEAILDPDPAFPGVSYLSVTADTSERARADLAALTRALEAAFPSAERNLSVSPNKRTIPAPNDLSRLVSLGVRTAMVLLALGGQLLMVIGAHRRGLGRAGLFAAIATPFLVALFPTSSYSRITHREYTSLRLSDYKFLLVLLAVTPVSVIVSLWLTRRSRRALGQHHSPQRPRPDAS